MMKKVIDWILRSCIAVFSIGLLMLFVVGLCSSAGSSDQSAQTESLELSLMDRYDMRMTNGISDALDGVLSIEKVYWLSDDDLVAPKPDPAKYGKSKDPAELGWLIEESKDLLDGQKLLFGTDTPVYPGTEINYYKDETILAVTWKQGMGSMYTICEVKIQHPSQLRRFLAGGEYGAKVQLQTTNMAATVNAVLASSGDFYGFRREGVVVYDGIVRRTNPSRVETCYIDANGDLHLSYTGELADMEEAQAFVDENDIRFSLSFGPILVDDGYLPEIDPGYYLGQPTDNYPRAALCQLGPLHYLVVVVNKEAQYGHTHDLYTFQANVASLGVKTAYTIDGGQTATVVMNGKVLNKLATGSQRYITDIFYFATAIPDGE